MLSAYAWAGRLGVKLQERAMSAPSRGRFVFLFAIEVLFATLFAVAFAIAGHGWGTATVIIAVGAGWATTRFLTEVPQWVRTVVVIAVVIGMLALGFFARPAVAVGLAAMFGYFSGWFLTFAVSPIRATRWRAVTRAVRPGTPAGARAAAPESTRP